MFTGNGYRINVHDAKDEAVPPGASKAKQLSICALVALDESTVVCAHGRQQAMQRRLIDCMRQARWPEPNYLADSIIALETFLQKTATGTVMETPGIKR